MAYPGCLYSGGFYVATVRNGITTMPPIDATIQPVFDLHCSTVLHPACQVITALPLHAQLVYCLPVWRLSKVS